MLNNTGFGESTYQSQMFPIKSLHCQKLFSRHILISVIQRAMSAGLDKPLVAVCQLTSKSNKKENFETCKKLIEKAKNQGACMVFLPECYDYVGESRAQSHELAEMMDGDIISQYKRLASHLGVWLSLGGGHEKIPDCNSKVFNTHTIIDHLGEICSVYRKTHLFDVDIPNKVRLKETDFTIPGKFINEPLNTPIGKLGLSTCYDLRFPELSVALTKMGAQVLTFPSAFTKTTGMAHWEPLLRARAIENQSYVIAAAQYGKHNAKRTSYGHAMNHKVTEKRCNNRYNFSQVVDPWGKIIASCNDDTDVAIATIDLEYLEKIREEMPVQKHRRNDLYPVIYPKSVPTYSDAFKASNTYQFGQVCLTGDQLFHKTHLSMAFVNMKPIAPGHVLISPLRVVQRLSDLTCEEISDLFSVVQKVQKVVEKVFNGTSCTVAIQDGPDAGQTIKHVHVHIVPRHSKDYLHNGDVYHQLQHHDKDNSRKSRSQTEMAAEATLLGQFFLSSDLS
ncbi:Nitrilase and fragile histidine triad fusion protein NitFhit [Nymphon striatum]|nr:Nitrilase and fragile histidine triad fusion protein NitFhit [Nymphon striatum]